MLKLINIEQHIVIQMTELIVILIIHHNVILQAVIIVQQVMKLVWLPYHTVYHKIIKHVSRTQEIFVTIQEMDQLGVTFTMIQIIVKLKMELTVTTLG